MANRSTGPRTVEGKKRSSLNALRHGLTGQTVVLPGEDLEAYGKSCVDFIYHLSPKGPLERQYVQTIVDFSWRLNRLRASEQNMLSFSARQCQDQAPPDPVLGKAQARPGLREASQRSQQLKSPPVKALQADRHADERDMLLKAAALKAHHDSEQAQQPQPLPYDPQADGFVFSRETIDYWNSARTCLQEGLQIDPPDLPGENAA